MKQNKIFFLHIPKTGGRTLNLVLQKIYKQKFYRITTKNTKISPEHFLRQTYSFILPDLHRVKNARLISGHYYFGFHNNFEEEPIYITLLRNPVERLLSEYYFVQHSDHYYQNLFVDSINSVEDYLLHPVTSRLKNLQCRMLSGIPIDDKAGPELIYNQAIYNLKNHIRFAGITEYFEFSLLELKKTLSWKNIPPYYAVNVNNRKPFRKKIDKNTILKIKESEYYDIKLYLFVLSNMRKRIMENSNWRSETSFRILDGPPIVSRIKSGIGMPIRKIKHFLK